MPYAATSILLVLLIHDCFEMVSEEKMSPMPIFEIGFWNAWVFLIPVFFMHMTNTQVFARRGAGDQSRKIPYMVLFLILHVLPIFLPLEPSTIWFYAGLVFYIVGIAIAFMAIHSFATTPSDKLVSKGVFHYSRNPIYLGGFISLAGISLATVSWVYFLIVPVWMIITHIVEISVEESECTKKYGTDYIEYMRQIPKWLRTPKSG